MGFLMNCVWDIIYHNDYVTYAKKLGARIGSDCKFLTNPRKCFGSEPWLIKIGNHVEISGGVTLLTHDGGIWIIREKHPQLAVWGTIEIGDNVFIGLGSIVMPNVHIGCNCIIGAGSIVTKDVPDNSVVAGVPARIINDYESFTKKIEKKAIPVLGMKQEMQIEFCKKYFGEFYEEQGDCFRKYS